MGCCSSVEGEGKGSAKASKSEREHRVRDDSDDAPPSASAMQASTDLPRPKVVPAPPPASAVGATADSEKGFQELPKDDQLTVEVPPLPASAPPRMLPPPGVAIAAGATADGEIADPAPAPAPPAYSLKPFEPPKPGAGGPPPFVPSALMAPSPSIPLQPSPAVLAATSVPDAPPPVQMPREEAAAPVVVRRPGRPDSLVQSAEEIEEERRMRLALRQEISAPRVVAQANDYDFIDVDEDIQITADAEDAIETFLVASPSGGSPTKGRGGAGKDSEDGSTAAASGGDSSKLAAAAASTGSGLDDDDTNIDLLPNDKWLGDRDLLPPSRLQWFQTPTHVTIEIEPCSPSEGHRFVAPRTLHYNDEVATGEGADRQVQRYGLVLHLLFEVKEGSMTATLVAGPKMRFVFEKSVPKQYWSKLLHGPTAEYREISWIVKDHAREVDDDDE